MKRLFFSSLMLLSLLALNAQFSNLVVFSEQGEPFYLILNGVQQNDTPETNVRVTNLNSDTYKVKVLFENPNLLSVDGDLYFVSKGNENVYNVKQNKNGEYKIRFVSSDPAPLNYRPVPQQRVIIYNTTPPPPPSGNNGRKAVTTSTTTTTSSSQANPAGAAVGLSVTDPETGLNMSLNVGGLTGTQSSSNVTTYTETTTVVESSGNGDGFGHHGSERNREPERPPMYVPGYTGPIGCPIPMTNEAFQMAKNNIASKDFEDTKVAVAKQIADANCFTSAQVRQLLDLFNFDNFKLDVAKYCYDHTYDIANYYMVNDAFQFKNFIDELTNYVRQRQAGY